jgi:hypothetical protein
VIARIWAVGPVCRAVGPNAPEGHGRGTLVRRPVPHVTRRGGREEPGLLQQLRGHKFLLHAAAGLAGMFLADHTRSR